MSLTLGCPELVTVSVPVSSVLPECPSLMPSFQSSFHRSTHILAPPFLFVSTISPLILLVYFLCGNPILITNPTATSFSSFSPYILIITNILVHKVLWVSLYSPNNDRFIVNRHSISWWVDCWTVTATCSGSLETESSALNNSLKEKHANSTLLHSGLS